MLDITGFLERVISGIIIFLLGAIVSKGLGRLTVLILQEFEVNYHLSNFGIRFPLDRTLGEAVSYLGYIITLYIALDQLGLVRGVTYVLLIIFLILFLLSFLVGLKDFFPNVVARSYLKRHLGKSFRFQGLQLKVLSIDLLETKMETKDGDILFFPNLQVHKELRQRK